MILVCDTGPIIALAKIDRLDVLRELGSRVLIPRAVYRELLAKVDDEFEGIETALGGFLEVEETGQGPVWMPERTAHLGRGEREAIRLATACGDQAVLIMDDRAGRTPARELGLSVLGVVGLLVRGKALGIVDSVGDTLEDMRANGYWLSDGVIRVGRRLAGEQGSGV